MRATTASVDRDHDGDRRNTTPTRWHALIRAFRGDSRLEVNRKNTSEMKCHSQCGGFVQAHVCVAGWLRIISSTENARR